MNVKQAADLIGVSTDTIRRWAGEEYTQFMSPTATPAKGQTRAFTRHDLAVLKFIATLRESGIDRLDILRRLMDMQNGGWEALPAIPDEWLNPDETVTIALAAARASEVAQIAALQTELSHTRQSLQEAQNRADLLATDLEAARSETAAQTGKIHALEVELERARADVARLESRLEGFNLAYGLGRDKPISIAVIILVALVLGALLVALAFILARVLM